MTTKVCSTCKVEKELDEFHNYKASKDGKQRKCKECGRLSTAKWQKANPEKVKATNAARYAANPEKEKFRSSLWKRENAKKHQESNRKSRANLATWHVVAMLRSNIRDTPQELIELKREQLKMYHATKQLQQALKEIENAS